MNLTTKYMTRNDCYNAGRKIKPIGIMIHSTASPGVNASKWFDLWNKSYMAKEIKIQACVHAFVDDAGVFQYLSWDHRGWHSGGSANNTHIGIEICEPAGFKYVNNVMVNYNSQEQEPYFRSAFNNAVELCAFLCKQFGFNESNIICHSEGYKKGIASNHSDVMHWFPKHNENMDTFRRAVKAELNKQEEKTMALDNNPSDWAKDAVDWALINRLITGDDKGNLMLHQPINREQFSVILKRYDEMKRAGEKND